ncbi:hypothetical protein [Rhodovulum sp. MB263]|uniref:hypothetical protein n=1 Tax=Rhodovulum sp. (strain MB263) TaxID=308754 RepID=UPI0009B7AE04|nr:hypothetical protein [Rhodovulum sp. MB263]ARC89043.1 hypothetical protein B5V46_10680 [Rhodovulum sp. MB263]
MKWRGRDLSLPEGTGGLPGPLTLRARYSVDGEGALEILLEAESGAPTFCNPAPHSDCGISSGEVIG